MPQFIEQKGVGSNTGALAVARSRRGVSSYTQSASWSSESDRVLCNRVVCSTNPTDNQLAGRVTTIQEREKR
jgi:hypothetical protein